MIKTYHETKRYKDQSNYFWFKNESYKPETMQIDFSSMSSSPEISLDGANFFTPTEQVTVQPGHKIYMRCSNGYFNANGETWSVSNVTGKWSVGGPLASLIDYTDQSNVTAIPAYCFFMFLENLAENGHLVDCSEIDFGNITEVSDYGMSQMFYYCPFKSGTIDLSNITEIGTGAMQFCFVHSDIKSVDLSGVTTLGTSALDFAFQYAGKLNEVHAPNVQNWDSSKTNDWLYGAGEEFQGTKTVYCPTGVTIPTDDTSGIPNGWTRIDY